MVIMSKRSAPKYPPSVKEALKTHDGAKSMVKALFESNQAMELSLRNTQDELETYRAKFHDADKISAILSEQNKVNVPGEIIKFISSALGIGFGVSLFFASEYFWGSLAIFASVVVYILVTVFARRPEAKVEK